MAVDLEKMRQLFLIARVDGPTLRDDMAMKMIEEIETLRAELASIRGACAGLQLELLEHRASIKAKETTMDYRKQCVERNTQYPRDYRP